MDESTLTIDGVAGRAENDELMVEELLFELFPYDTAIKSYVAPDDVMKVRYRNADRAFKSDDDVVTMRFSEQDDAFLVEGLAELLDRDIDPAKLISADTPNLIKTGTDGKLLALDDANVLVDPRDGRRYKTVLMPDGHIWMAENLNYVTPGSYENNNDPANGAIYGRLYTKAAAMAVAPPGWHLPTKEEWDALVAAVGASPAIKLKSTDGWNSDGNGTDDFGFTALPGGIDASGIWWSSSNEDERFEDHFIIEFSKTTALLEGCGSPQNKHSVRCIKNNN